VLLKHLEELIRFRQRQAEMLNALAGFLQDDDIGVGFFVAIVINAAWPPPLYALVS
jgi:hypothetical protein